jgi:hypothetical protein
MPRLIYSTTTTTTSNKLEAPPVVLNYINTHNSESFLLTASSNIPVVLDKILQYR